MDSLETIAKYELTDNSGNPISISWITTDETAVYISDTTGGKIYRFSRWLDQLINYANINAAQLIFYKGLLTALVGSHVKRYTPNLEFKDQSKSFSNPAGITAGGGKIWVADREPAIYILDVRTMSQIGKIEHSLLTGPKYIAYSYRNGHIYVYNNISGDKLIEIDENYSIQHQADISEIGNGLVAIGDYIYYFANNYVYVFDTDLTEVKRVENSNNLFVSAELISSDTFKYLWAASSNYLYAMTAYEPQQIDPDDTIGFGDWDFGDDVIIGGDSSNLSKINIKRNDQPEIPKTVRGG